MTFISDWLTASQPKSAFQANMVSFTGMFTRFLMNPTNLIGVLILTTVIMVAIFAPLLAHFSPYQQNLAHALQPPGETYWFGTDELGRDIYSRMLYGTRITLMIAFIVSVIAAPIGLIVGAVAGYVGGWTDVVLTRLIDIFLSFPSLILALAFVAALGPSLENAVIAIALTVWPPIARLARAEAKSFAATDAIAAVRIQGASTLRIIAFHIIPVCLPSVIVRISLNMAGIILTAAGLGFLGLGAQPPLPEWGAMLSAGRQYMLTAWWLAAIPGIAIMTVSLGFNLVGDGLRDALDPYHD